jgi:hypothetical protein
VTEFVRPDLRIPLAPLSGSAEVARHYVLGLRNVNFANPRRLAMMWAATGCLLAALSVTLPEPWRRGVAVGSALVALYAVGRMLALTVTERRQRAFERDWLTARTETLRGHAFDLLRFSVTDLTDRGQGGRRAYDLTSPDVVRELLGLRDQDLARPRPTLQATVEFAYVGAGSVPSVADVHRDLRELVFLAGQASPGQESVRFPEARYLPRPALGGQPAQATNWVLSGPVILAVGGQPYAEGAAASEAPTDTTGPSPAR